MESKKVEDINYKVVFINAAISATATGLVLWLMGRLSGGEKKTGLSGALRFFAHLPISDQARFADPVTFEMAKDPKWLVEQTANMDPKDPTIYKNLNRTAIANCAYIALYGAHEGSRRKCSEILENLKNIM